MLIALCVIRAGYASTYLALGAQNSAGFVQVAATFAFSMMGFMAAVMALFSVLGQSKAFRKYRNSGFLKVLLMGIAITLAELTLTFVASMQLFFVIPTVDTISCVVLALTGSLGMVVATSVPIVALQIRSAGERS